MVTYVDNCGDAGLSSLQRGWTLEDMETSVLRHISGTKFDSNSPYDSATNIYDAHQTIEPTADDKPKLLLNDVNYNVYMCGDLGVRLAAG